MSRASLLGPDKEFPTGASSKPCHFAPTYLLSDRLRPGQIPADEVDKQGRCTAWSVFYPLQLLVLYSSLTQGSSKSVALQQPVVLTADGTGRIAAVSL